ncbi:MAG: hypothetical protein MJE66_18980 [Proteobacteria bacterium]|nr:hypothetical protein [Pseudomonadota bacterium]
MPRRDPELPPEAESPSPAPDERMPQAWCPQCSARLAGRSCKQRCPRCGYFDDCSNLI